MDQLSGGKLAYVYLPDTGEGGFTNFNRYYFAQTEKQGAIIDERFNGGGQMADYLVEVMGRHIESYWAPRYGRMEHTPNAAIYGPKVMIANEVFRLRRRCSAVAVQAGQASARWWASVPGAGWSASAQFRC